MKNFAKSKYKFYDFYNMIMYVSGKMTHWFFILYSLNVFLKCGWIFTIIKYK